MQDSPRIDILAIAAHRDDVEQSCGGTLLKAAQAGWRTGILDLTQGEAGTRGSAAERKAEAEAAAKILRTHWRQALDMPDGRLENSWENRVKISRVLRALRPRVVILPYWQARHPDHAMAGQMGYDACFAAGLAKTEIKDEHGQALAAHRPYKIVYATVYADVRPSFVVDITAQMDERFASLIAYQSQYANHEAGSGVFVPAEEIRERVYSLARYYGGLAGVRYGEPFVQKEVGLVDDLMTLGVQSI
jgi:bacillithiol biosynthesis deacetylase BshB1